MKSVTIIATVAAAIAVLSASTAFANTTYRHSGHNCQPRDAADTNWWYDSRGIRNDSASVDDNRVTWCPLAAWQGSTVNLDEAKVFYHDGTEHHSVRCQVFVTNNTGGVFSSSQKFSCSSDTSSGCTSESGGYQGFGSLAWTGSALPNSGGNISDAGAYGIFCRLPSRANFDGEASVTEQYSHIISYMIDQQNP